MAGHQIPRDFGMQPFGSGLHGSNCVAGFSPGPLCESPSVSENGGGTARGTLDLAAQPARRFTTDASLLTLAKTVMLSPEQDKAVFYAEDEGTRRATQFIAANPGYTRLDELLAQTLDGRELWKALTQTPRPWSDKEEVWWELSHRFARAAAGVVHVFGPVRFVEDRPVEEFLHKFADRPSYANTVFEKVELPELEQNVGVTSVFYNGLPFD